MNKVISSLKPEVKKLILDSYPVVKKRSALWFFTEEVKKNLSAESTPTVSNGSLPRCPGKKLRKNQIWVLWNSMDPECKRKYFNMAEFDEVRYKEQKCLWIAEVGSLLVKHGNEISKFVDSVPTQEATQKEFIETLEKYQKSYNRMIQIESTRSLYKDVIENSDNLHPEISTEKLLSKVPKDYRPILSRPRRPAQPFILFVTDHKEKITNLRRAEYPDYSFLKLASLEWAKLSPEERADYDKRYNRLMDEYNKAMEQFRMNISSSNAEIYLDRASKEKKAFRKSLRKRLREFEVVPVNVRNAFNFFLMENKNIPLTELTKIWRTLTEEEKLKYKQMNQEDVTRYYKEKTDYDELMNSLNNMFKKK